MKLRIKYSKHGPVKYIGHLDFMRYFQKCIRRAGIDIAYSKGFSPHQIMSFALALGVGVETDGDYMDIEVCSIPGCGDLTNAGEDDIRDGLDDIKNSLNKTMAEGVRVENVILLSDDAPNAMSSVAAAGYILIPKEGRFDPAISLACNRLMAKEEIIVAKENKKAKKKGRAVEGVNDVIYTDIKEHIYECSMDEEKLTCMVDASSAGNVRPLSLLEAIYGEAGLGFDPLDIQVIRTDTYTRRSDSENEFVPLDAL